MGNTQIPFEKYEGYQKLVSEEYLGTKPRYSAFAVALELEHEISSGSLSHIPGWVLESDGSLGRSGVEFISRSPVTKKNLDKHINVWYNKVSELGVRLSESTNTSTHVHVNCQHLRVHQLISVLAVAYMVEPLLFSLCRSDRLGNNFCVAGFSDHRQIHDVCSLLRNGYVPSASFDERYAALNLAALRKFGSLEFRQMHGLSDPSEIKGWVNLLYWLTVNASSKPIDEWNTLYLEKPLDVFLTMIFGDDGFKYLLETGYDGKLNQMRAALRKQSKIFPWFLRSSPRPTPPRKRSTRSTQVEEVDHTSLFGSLSASAEMLSDVYETHLQSMSGPTRAPTLAPQTREDFTDSPLDSVEGDFVGVDVLTVGPIHDV